MTFPYRLYLFCRTALRLGLACAIGAALFGCASTSKMAKPLNEFSAITSDSTTVTTAVLTVVQSVDQESQAIELTREPPKSLKEGIVQPIFRPNDLLQRQLALQSLATYAATLKALATVDRSADIQKSFDSLKTSLDSSANTIAKLASGSTMQIPSGVVSGIVSLGSILAKAYALQEREKAIRAALETSDGTITRICNLLSSELRPGGAIYDQLKHDFNTQEEAADDKYQATRKPASETDAKPPAEAKPPPDLTPLFKSFAAIKTKKDYSLALLNSLAASYRQIAQVHTALKIQSETGVASSAQLRQLSAQIDNAKLLNAQISK
jgi:hypothetical protein